MTFGEYIKTIADTKIFIDSQVRMVVKLFEEAEASREVVPETARTWIRDKSKCRTRDYFPKDTVNETGVIQYFRTRTSDNTWKTLQKAFLDKDDCIVNCETDDKEVFYRSLLNQFLASLGLPRSEEPDNDKVLTSDAPLSLLDSNKDGFLSQNETSSEAMLILFLQAVNDYRISAFMQSFKDGRIRESMLINVIDFIEIIDSNIVCKNVYKNEGELYSNIEYFARLLGKYKELILKNFNYNEDTCTHYLKRDKAEEYNKNAFYFLYMLDSLYGKIDQGNSLTQSDTIEILVNEEAHNS